MSPQETYQISFPNLDQLDGPASVERGRKFSSATALHREDTMRRLFLILCLLLLVTGSSASLAQSKLDASIFSYDGKDFVRTETTLMKEGQAAVGTKLAPDSPAYKALIEKHSYTGPMTLFGKDYQANYAPLTGEDGKLTGALFVGVPKSRRTRHQKPLSLSGHAPRSWAACGSRDSRTPSKACLSVQALESRCDGVCARRRPRTLYPQPHRPRTSWSRCDEAAV